MKLLSRIWSNTSSKRSESEVYKTCAEINIKTFYDIIKNDDITLLVKSGEVPDNIEEIWENIYDEYCSMADDGNFRSQLRLRARINSMKAKLYFCTGVVDIMTKGNTTDKTIARCYEVLRKYGYILDEKKAIAKNVESLIRSMNQLQTQISLKTLELDKGNKKTEINLMKSVVKLKRALKIDIDIFKTSVEEWVYLNKEALEISHV